MRCAVALGALVTLALAAGCGGEVPAAKESLESAQDNVERADRAIDEMQDTVRSLESEQARLRKKLESTVRKQVDLWQQQLAVYREQLTRLPAEAEERLEPELDTIHTEVEALDETLKRYASAAVEQAPRIRTELEEKISELRNSFARFDQAFREASE
jgi:chromosome segregation ATPase